MKRLYKHTCTALSVLCIAALVKAPVPVFADSTAADPKTSYTYKLFNTEEEYETELETKMGRVYDVLQGHIQQKNVCPIPGLVETVYHEEADLKDSIYYIPQGICRTDDFIIVTAYHNGKVGLSEMESNKGWKGIIYVIDGNTHEYLTTLALPQTYHNGGIAYDGERVWFCGNTSDSYLKDGDPFVQCMDYSRLKEIVAGILADGDRQDGCIAEEDFSDKITINNKPSFLECTDGFLWVGTYVNNNPDDNVGYAVGYPIMEENGTAKLDKLHVKRINGIPSSAQGMDIDGNDLYVSSSGHGGENYMKSSFISRFDITSLMKDVDLLDLQGQSISRVEVPKMNEEILVDEDAIYLVFEAAGEQFLHNLPDGMKTDRLLPLDKTLWNMEE